MTEASKVSVMVARANAYHTLTRAFEPPAEMDVAHPQLLRETFQGIDSLREVASKVANEWKAALEDPESMTLAYTRLFLGPFEILAPPYASLYLDPERRLMGQISQDVAQAFTEAGLGPCTGPKEVPDHVTHELEFMYFLAFQGATTGDPIWAERQRHFWKNHLGLWLPRLADAIAQTDCHDFYTALAEFLQVFCDKESY